MEYNATLGIEYEGYFKNNMDREYPFLTHLRETSLIYIVDDEAEECVAVQTYHIIKVTFTDPPEDEEKEDDEEEEEESMKELVPGVNSETTDPNVPILFLELPKPTEEEKKKAGWAFWK